MFSPERSAEESRVMVEVNSEEKSVRMRFCGAIQPGHVSAAVNTALLEATKLGSGFVLVTDLTDLENMDIDCFRGLTRMMDLFVEAGLGRVIRIIPDPRKDIGFQLLGVVHYRGKVPTTTYSSRAEADHSLSQG
jgi:hypothetical protein